MMKNLLILIASLFVNAMMVNYYRTVTANILHWMQDWNMYFIFSISWLVLFITVAMPMYILVTIESKLLISEPPSIKMFFGICCYFPFLVIVALSVKNTLNIPMLINLIGMSLASEICKQAYYKDLLTKTFANPNSEL